jgi:multimeric flavodoxin WrbA
MSKTILMISGSPKKDGNTHALMTWFQEGARAGGATVEVVRAADLKVRHPGCTSCRACQKNREYGCVVKDDLSGLIQKMIGADVIVMATPLYFFAMSAQIKMVMDRMFSLYKWDNDANTMATVLKGKTLMLMASAYEDVGLRDLQIPFKITADYTGMHFDSLLVPNAGVSGRIVKCSGVREQASALGARAAAGT